MHFVTPQFDFWSDLVLILGILFIGQGLIQVIGGKLIGKEYNNFTEESKRRFARPAGVCYLVAGCALALYNFVEFEASGLIAPILAFAIAVVAIVAMMVIATKTLKEAKNKTKNPKKTAKKS